MNTLLLRIYARGQKTEGTRQGTRDPWVPYLECQMVSFQTKNPTLGKFGRALDWKMFIYIL
jgi:hypothetical protein